MVEVKHNFTSLGKGEHHSPRFPLPWFAVENLVKYQNGFCPYDQQTVKIDGQLWKVIGVEAFCIRVIPEGCPLILVVERIH